MIRTLRLLPDRQGANEEGLGLGISGLFDIQRCEVVETSGDIVMIRPQRLLFN